MSTNSTVFPIIVSAIYYTIFIIMLSYLLHFPNIIFQITDIWTQTMKIWRKKINSRKNLKTEKTAFHRSAGSGRESGFRRQLLHGKDRKTHETRKTHKKQKIRTRLLSETSSDYLNSGAVDGTWTHTSVDTRPSNVPVCLFQHDREQH